MPKQERGSDYLLQRMKKDAPAIHADYQAGRYKSVREAAIAAGLRKPTNELNVLKGAWKRASQKEREDFLDWTGARAAPAAASGAADPDRRLLPAAKSRIEFIMMRRRLKMGDVMDEMRFNRLNTSLGLAMRTGSRLAPSVVAALEKWLDDNKSIK